MVQQFSKAELKKWHRASTYIDAREYEIFLQRDRIASPWVGVSLQHREIDYMRGLAGQDFANALRAYVNVVQQLLNTKGEAAPWMVQHERLKYPWLPPHLPEIADMQALHAFFEQHGIDRMFVGGLLVDAATLTEILPCLIQYPAIFKYRDLNMFHSQGEVVIKVGHHFTIDLISNQMGALADALAGLNLEGMEVVHYR